MGIRKAGIVPVPRNGNDTAAKKAAKEKQRKEKERKEKERKKKEAAEKKRREKEAEGTIRRIKPSDVGRKATIFDI